MKKTLILLLMSVFIFTGCGNDTGTEYTYDVKKVEGVKSKDDGSDKGKEDPEEAKDGQGENPDKAGESANSLESAGIDFDKMDQLNETNRLLAYYSEITTIRDGIIEKDEQEIEGYIKDVESLLSSKEKFDGLCESLENFRIHYYELYLKAKKEPYFEEYADAINDTIKSIPDTPKDNSRDEIAKFVEGHMDTLRCMIVETEQSLKISDELSRSSADIMKELDDSLADKNLDNEISQLNGVYKNTVDTNGVTFLYINNGKAYLEVSENGEPSDKVKYSSEITKDTYSNTPGYLAISTDGVIEYVIPSYENGEVFLIPPDTNEDPVYSGVYLRVSEDPVQE